MDKQPERNILRSLRMQMGWNQSEAARHIGVDRTALYMWETNQRMPSLTTAARVAKLYGTTLDEIWEHFEKQLKEEE